MKGVILAAGYGTRFLPATKTIPKEMFPLIDTPAIDLIVQEMIESGVEDILIVSSRRKKSMEDYFDREVELETSFREEGAKEKLQRIHPANVNIFYLRQQVMAGTGDALLLVEPFVGDDPFVVAYPDDVLINGPPLTSQLIELYERTGKTVLAGQHLEGDVSRYGVVDETEQDGVYTVRSMVEKPAPGTEPSHTVCYGRYLYTPELFDALRSTHPGDTSDGEFTQTDAINFLAERGRVVVQHFTGDILDVGTPKGYLEAFVEFGLRRPEYRDNFLAFLQRVVQRETEGS